MASHFSRLPNFFAGIVFGCGFGFVISIAPLLAIEHKRLIPFFLHQALPQLVCEAIVVIGSALAWALAFAKVGKPRVLNGTPWLKANAFAFLATSFLFLYVACAHLCSKLNVALMPISSLDKESWQWLGVFFTLGAATLTISSLLSPTNQRPQARSNEKSSTVQEHPICLAGLIYLLASALSFATWFPLLAIPGAFVVILWHIRKEPNATAGDVRAG